MAKLEKMTPADAARIQSAGAKQTGGTTPKDSFAARAQSAGAKNTGKGGKK
jgi:protein-tyrosine-phosphatase